MPLAQFTLTHLIVLIWSGSDDSSGIDYYDVEYQTDGGEWREFKTKTTETSGQITDGRPGVTYGFRARAVDKAGNVQPWSETAQAETTVSIGEPGARIIPFPFLISTEVPLLVKWEGYAPLGASIVSYDVQYNFNGGPWIDWLIDFVEPEDLFPAPQGDGIYGFQVRAQDNAGRISPYIGGPEGIVVVDAVAPHVTIRIYGPVIMDQ
jgi:hypothetical protein